MFEIDINLPQKGGEVHTCKSHKEGDEIVFTCPHCPDYERRMNLKTGEMKVKNASEDIRHTGSHVSSIFNGLSTN